MSIQHTVTTTWSDGSSTVKTVRALTSDVAGAIDVVVPALTANVPAVFSVILAKVKLIVIATDGTVTLHAGGVNARQQIATTGTVVSGTFILTFGGNTTAAINWDASAADVAAALNALPLGAGGFTCTGGPLPATPVVVEFTGPYATAPQATMTHTDSLTGGAVAITSLTTGVVPDTTFVVNANVGRTWDYQGGDAQPFLADVSTLRFTNALGSDANVKVRTLSSL